MRLYVLLAAALLSGMLLLSACNSNEQAGRHPSSSQPSNPGSVQSSTQPQLPAPAPAGEEAQRITPAELKDKLASGQAILVDVRGEAAYNQSHIKGSIQIPFAEIANHADELPRNKLIVTYCS